MLSTTDHILPDPMLPAVFRVGRTHAETHDIFTMDLRAEGPSGGFRFEPGQFTMVYVHGTGEIPLSISGDPANTDRITHTTRAIGTVTNALRRLKRGDSVGIRGPFGNGWPLQQTEGRDVIIIAGGIGLAPLRPAVYALLHRRSAIRRLILLYGTRTPADILFRNELEEWRGRLDMDVSVTVDRGMEDWRGNVGFVSMFIGKAPFDPANAIALLCGPEVMMRVCATELVKRGVPLPDIHVSLERNMKCAIGFCGHCQLGPYFICKDGPVFSYPMVRDLLSRWEV